MQDFNYNNISKMVAGTSSQTWLLRTAVVLGMCAAVVTILYFTPGPEHHFLSCDRACHELDWPMICRIKLNIEEFRLFTRSYNQTMFSTTDLFAANRQLPGPTLQVCQNDILLIDVSNKISGREVALHWRGQTQHKTQVMDGVPMITQCPIASQTTFQYKFRVTQPGTHFWHAHSGDQSAAGLFGSLVVKQPNVLEPQKRLYDIDTKDFVIILSEMEIRSKLSDLKNNYKILINGEKEPENLVFLVKKGIRYRFRLAFGAGLKGCPIEVSMDHHNLKVIALDGHPINPYDVSNIIFNKGERVDFVLKANQPNGKYMFRFVSKCGVSTSAILQYEDGGLKSKLPPSDIEPRTFTTEPCDSKPGNVCLKDVQSLFVMPSSLRNQKVDSKFYLEFGRVNVSDFGSSDLMPTVSHCNNITFTYPSSPLLTQRTDIHDSMICEETLDQIDTSDNQDLESEVVAIPKQHRKCTHIFKIENGNSAELVLINNGDDLVDESIFHLHGYSFWIVGSKKFDGPISRDDVIQMDSFGELFSRSLLSPARKDTIRIPKYTVVAIRFVADNPGYWLLRDELSESWTRGQDVIIQVGSAKDLATPPSDFPRCGNWVGPEFFLA